MLSFSSPATRLTCDLPKAYSQQIMYLNVVSYPIYFVPRAEGFGDKSLDIL